MTDKEKAIAYDEALKVAKEWHTDAQPGFKANLEKLFPELRESEDERIRKFIIHLLNNHVSNHVSRKDIKECITWLEKQGESEPSDKVGPKFHGGDWVVTDKNNIVRIKTVDGNYYTLENKIKFTIDYVDKCWHSWTIQDAKDGDVLLFEGNYNSIVLYQGIGINGKGRINYHCKCDLGDYSFGIQGDVACLGTIEKDAEHYHPATKEQRDLLFQKIKEAGYEWYAEKKELMKIEQKRDWDEEDERIYQSIIDDTVQENQLDSKQIDWLKSIKSRVQPKQEWSEEDENKINHLIAYFEDKEGFTAEDDIAYANWLNSLKERCAPQPKQEWSEEDVYNSKLILATIIQDQDLSLETKNKLSAWLKSLKPQPKQEWSEEDERKIDSIIETIRIRKFEHPQLAPVYDGDIDWLKSLRPQNTWKPSDEQMNNKSLDTSEVKEIDLEKEISDYLILRHLHIEDGGRIVFDNNDSPNFMCDIRHIAEYFFELGQNTPK